MLQRIAALIVLISAVAHGQTSARRLSCDLTEPVALTTAPLGATRVSPHELRVQWKSGTRVFRDSGVVAGDMGGIDYRYCGYDAATGFHLIFKHDDAIFGGVLLEQSSGRVLPAGQLVLFAPGATRYFATVQPDGLEGEEWHVYSLRAGQLWTGVSGIPKGKYLIAKLTKPRWSTTGELKATATCFTDTTHTAIVTLRRQGKHFVWRPTVSCPPPQREPSIVLANER